MIREHQTLKDSVGTRHLIQNNINQDLLKQISQHESIHDHLSTQLNEQKEMRQRLIEQIRKNEIELNNQLTNKLVKLKNKINGMIREHQIFKVIVDSYHFKQNDINQDLKKQIDHHEEIFNKLDDQTELNQNLLKQIILNESVPGHLQLNEQKDSSQGHSEQIQNNENAHILSKQLNLYFESIQEIKNQFDMYESMLSEQFSIQNEMLQYPFASLLNILPSNYPVESIFVNGKQESVTKFLSVNHQDKIAFFLDGENIKYFEYCSIEGITWGEE